MGQAKHKNARRCVPCRTQIRATEERTRRIGWQGKYPNPENVYSPRSASANSSSPPLRVDYQHSVDSSRASRSSQLCATQAFQILAFEEEIPAMAFRVSTMQSTHSASSR